MIAAWIVLGAIALSLLAWWAARYRPARRNPDSAVSVRELIERVESETSSSGRHRGTTTIRGELADDIETKILPLPPEIRSLDHEDQARNLPVLQRVAAGLKRI